jgi:hypothetical protein
MKRAFTILSRLHWPGQRNLLRSVCFSRVFIPKPAAAFGKLCLGFLAAFPTGAAFADNRCFVPMTQWQPRDAVQRLAQQNGWNVRRIKIDDGCYEIDGRDTEGRRIEVTIHPATLEVF